VIPLPSAAAILALVVGAAASPSAIDGSPPLCRADRGHDCTPGADDCKVLQPQTDKPALFHIDFAKKEIRSPFRTTVLTVTHTTDNSESLVLQGATCCSHEERSSTRALAPSRSRLPIAKGRMSSSPAARMLRTSRSSAIE
jgi:hypothetical protein